MDLSLILYLHSLHLNLSTIGVLRYYAKEMEYFLPAKHKLKSDLEKYGYVHQDKITSKGLELLEEIDNWSETYVPQKQRKKKDIVYSKEFLSWWSVFPTSDNIHGFEGTRDLKKNKQQSFIEWEKLMKEYTPEQIMDCLAIEVEIRIAKGKKLGINDFTYMNNTEVWLKNRKFEKYLNQKETTKNSKIVVIPKNNF